MEGFYHRYRLKGFRNNDSGNVKYSGKGNGLVPEKVWL